MPYRTVSSARKHVPSLKNMSDHQVRIFNRVLSSLIRNGVSEKDAFPQAIGQASKFKKKHKMTKQNKSINKMFYKELGDILESALKDKYCVQVQNPYYNETECSPDLSLEDFDESYVYFEVEDMYYKESYSYTEATQEVVLGDDKVEVIEQTTYVEKTKETVNKKAPFVDSMMNMFEDFLIKCASQFGGSAKEQGYVDNNIPVIKQFTEEKMEAIEPLYCLPDEQDLHKEAMTETEIRKMVDNLNKNIKLNKVKGNIGHAVNTDKIEPLVAWVQECDCMIGDHLVKEGQPIIKMKFHDTKLWEARKSGVLMGVSIGARGQKVEQ